MQQNFEKGFPSAKPNSDYHSSENDENGSSQDSAIPKKKAAAKHFMSPTISASSKARKKVLVDRNENYIAASDSDGEKRNVAANGSSLNAFDHSSYNCLSPRPRYLRFDPNKRREVFTRLEREECDLSELSPFDSSNGTDLENPSEEDGKISKVPPFKDDDDDDDLKKRSKRGEEKDSAFRGVIKIMLTAVSCLLLSVSYLCSMNNPPSPSISENVTGNLSHVYESLIIKEQQLFEPIYSNPHGNNGFMAKESGYDFGGPEIQESKATYEEPKVGDLTKSPMQKNEPKTASTATAVFSPVSFVILLLPLALLHCYYRKKNNQLAEESLSHTVKQNNFLPEHRNNNNNNVMEESYERIIEDDTCAPTVELLGEVFIGQVGSSLRIRSVVRAVKLLRGDKSRRLSWVRLLHGLGGGGPLVEWIQLVQRARA